MQSKYDLAKLSFSVEQASAALGAGSSVNLLVKCPAASAQFYGAWLALCAMAAGLHDVFLFQGPTTSLDGSALTPQNRNRLDTPPSCPVQVFNGPTISVDGTQLTTGKAALSQNFDSGYWLLKPGTNYLVRITNTTAGALASVLGLKLAVVPNSDFLR